MEYIEFHLDIFCTQARLPVEGMYYIQLSCWPRGFHGNSQATQADAKTNGSSAQAHSEASLWKTSIQLIEHGEAKLVPIWNIPPVFQSLRYVKVLWRQPKTNIDTNPAIQCLTYNLSCV